MTHQLHPKGSNELLSDLLSAEKRRHHRVQLSVRCWIGDGTHTVYLRVYDLSLGGLSVRAPVPFQPSRELQLSMELPERIQVRARGKVVWVQQPLAGPESRPRMGVRFLEFLEGEEALRTLLSASP